MESSPSSDDILASGESSAGPAPGSFVSKDPLHGITLETIVVRLVENFGWRELGRRIDIRCFNFNPSVKSSLQFLRRTPWAREKVEKLYVRELAAGENTHTR